jgi:RNA polymerase sigma factor (sigma-70 family)
MTNDSLDTLLVKLSSGDDSAAERVFRDYEPILRALVRRRLTPMLRTKFDSMDVVQSVWADLLAAYRSKGWQFNDREHLRAFLAKVTYNHFLIQCRRNHKALRSERPLPDRESLAPAASGQATPSQMVQAVELWETIVGDCPPAHAEILRLKRQGLSLAEIASRTGFHESSVRRILYELARRMADRTPRPGRATSPVR